jgi:hypothetical protein
MQHFRKATNFLNWLNRCVVVREVSGEMEILPRPDSERYHGQEVLPLETPRRLAWNIEVEEVLEGSCSASVVPRGYDARKFPMGVCATTVENP